MSDEADPRRDPAADAALEALYDQMRAIAASHLRGERAGHTLQPTALVHEAWLRLIDQRQVDWSDPRRVLPLAAQMMRRILVDHARGRGAAKRGGGRERIDVDDAALAAAAPAAAGGERLALNGVDLLALDEALERLAVADPQAVRVVELRFFAGLELAQIATVLDLGRRSVDRSWAGARAWLHREIVGAGESAGTLAGGPGESAPGPIRRNGGHGR